MTSNPPLQLLGRQIDLIEVQPSYFASIVRWRNDPDNQRYFFSRRGWTMEGQGRWYERYCEDPGDATFVAVLKTGLPVGTVALYQIDRRAGRGEMGRVLNGEQTYRRRGIALEACSLCLSYAFDSLELDQVMLESYADNLAALRLYERLGFVTEQHVLRSDASGAAHPVCRMALERSQWIGAAPLRVLERKAA